jgi:hypothetical protein
VVPIVTGHVDWAALDRLAEIYLATHASWTAAASTSSAATASSHADGAEGRACGGPGTTGGAGLAAKPCDFTCGKCDCRLPEPLSPGTRQRLRRALLALAADTLSGPGGLAAQLRAASLRTGPDRDPLASVSLPLDVGPATETIPAHLRRAVTSRHPHCTFPGCTQPASVCDVHHIIPRSRGGPTSLENLVTLCTFHHKIVVHRWGWTLRLNSDGTTTATSPDGRILRSHGPPRQAARVPVSKPGWAGPARPSHPGSTSRRR